MNDDSLLIFDPETPNTNPNYLSAKINLKQFLWTATNFNYSSSETENKADDNSLIIPYFNNYNSYYGIDMAVVKVDLTDQYKKAVKQKNNDLLRYFDYLKQNVSVSTNDVQFSADYNNSSGYLVSYPELKSDANNSYLYSSIINTQIKNEIIPKQIKDNGSLENSIEVEQLDDELPKTYISPEFSYLIPKFNVGNGSSGSALIGYNPNSNTPFIYKGIYWGGLSLENNSNSFMGAIALPIKENSYNLIGGSKIITKLNLNDQINENIKGQNKKTDNNLCGYINEKIKNNKELNQPSFC